MTEWRDIPSYEGLYEVSDDGQVRGKEGRVTINSKGVARKWISRILKQRVSKNDLCCRVNLWKDGKEKTWLVHRLVALAFLEKPEGKDCINHKDGNRLNNHIKNLEWCDYVENQNHAFDNNLTSTNKKVVLVNIKTKECHYFRSLSYASVFLGFSEKYLSSKIIEGKNKINGYEIYTLANT